MRYFLLLISLLLIMYSLSGCKKDDVQEKIIYQDKIVYRDTCINEMFNTCFVFSPVRNNSDVLVYDPDHKLDKEYDLYLQNDSLLLNAKAKKRYDFWTHYYKQKQISVQFDCEEKLKEPDSSYISDIWVSYCQNPKIRLKIFFDSAYTKNIAFFGKAVIYEYGMNHWSEVSANKIYIILSKDEKISKFEYHGIVLISFGLEWKKLSNGEDVFVLWQGRRGRWKDEYLMLYQDEAFRSVAYKRSKWMDYHERYYDLMHPKKEN